MKRAALGTLLAALLFGCGQEGERPATPDRAAFRQAMQEHTETLLRVHFRLDSAATELVKAEEQAAAGNHSAADYHVSEARRYLDAADDIVLELGQELQRQFNLDAADGSRN